MAAKKNPNMPGATPADVAQYTPSGTDDPDNVAERELELDERLPKAQRPLAHAPPPALPPPPPTGVTLQRTQIVPTDDQALWVAIRYAAQSISWDVYANFMDQVMCGLIPTPKG